MWVAVVVTLGSGSASAQLRAFGTVGSSVGITDNVAGSVQGSEVADGFARISPSLVVAYEADRTLHHLAYSFSYFLYMQHPDINSYANRLRYATSFQPSAHTRLAFAAGGTHGKRQLYNLLEAADSSDPNVLADDRISETFATAGVSQFLAWEITPVWELSQSVAFEAYVPIESELTRSTNYSVGGLLGVGRNWSFDALTLRLRVDFFTFGEYELEGDLRPAQHGVMSRADLQWLHDLTPSWSTELTTGATAAIDVDESSHSFVHPLVLAAIRYRQERWQVEVAVEHSARPDLLTSRITLNNSANISASYPFDRQADWVARATAGYRYSIFNEEGEWSELSEGYHGVLCDAGLSWRAHATLYLDARYQFMRLSGGGLGQSDSGVVSAHVGLLGVTFTYPPEGLPIRVPSLRRTRVDRGVQ
jgi:hypothetical protein